MFIYKIIIWFVYLITRPSISQIKGLENLPKDKGFIIAANHVSACDPLMVAAALRKFAWKHFLPRNKRFYFIGAVGLRRKIFKYHFISVAINVFREKMAYLPADRQGLKRAIELLEDGNIIIIFPEGHMNASPCLLRGKKGVALMMLYSGAPVVPAGCFAPRVRNVWQFIKRLFKEKKVVFGSSILVSRAQPSQNRRFYEKSVKDIMDIIMSSIAQVCNKHYSPIQQQK